jgi:catechol 2,3-dioxygenase-like lactoylglutathione lyase family enzyme
MAFVVDRINHVVLNCRDVDAAIDWYVRVLGMRREVFGVNRTALVFGSQEDQRASHRRGDRARFGGAQLGRRRRPVPVGG